MIIVTWRFCLAFSYWMSIMSNEFALSSDQIILKDPVLALISTIIVVRRYIPGLAHSQCHAILHIVHHKWSYVALVVGHE